MNQVGLVGRITKEPILRQLSGNRAQTHFSLAINRPYKNQNGGVDTDFIYCTVWGKLAEHVVKYCGKGSLIGVNGRIQSRNFDREDGVRVFMTDIVAESIRFYQLKSREQQDHLPNVPPVDFIIPDNEMS